MRFFPHFMTLLSAALLTVSCNSQPNVEEVDFEAVDEMRKSEEVIVLDVRTEKEFEEGHIPEAVNIDIYDREFVQKLRELNPGKKIVVHCRSGSRSLKAVKIMKEAGFENIYHYSGGILDWGASEGELE